MKYGMASLEGLLARMENSKSLTALRKGFVVMIPLLMAGAVALLLRSLPIPAFQKFQEEFLGGILGDALVLLYNATYGMISFYLAIIVSGQYAKVLQPGDTAVQGFAMLVSGACFSLSITGENWVPNAQLFGSGGVFLAVMCALASTRIFCALYALFCRRNHYYVPGGEMDVKRAMTAIVPLLTCLVIFLSGSVLVRELFKVSNVNELLIEIVNQIFKYQPNELLRGILFVFLLHFLWLFGIHGGNVLDQVSMQIFLPGDSDPSVIISKSFMDNFAMLGGCGGTICLLLAMFLVSRTESNRRLARSCLPFSLFNINELLVFGFPLVLNPIMAIPFVLVPLCSLVNAYLFTIMGVLPVVDGTVTWTTPVLFSGYAAVHSVWGIVVQALNIAIGTLLYIPFLRFSEKLQGQKQKQLLTSLGEAYKRAETNGTGERFLDRQDNLGEEARRLVSQLRADLENSRILVFYQPQVDRSGKVCGAEALLRWGYGGGPLYPPLVVSLAQEDGIYDRLTQCVITQTLHDIPALRPKGCRTFLVSANITAVQLNSTAFVRDVIAQVRDAGMEGAFGLEVTEGANLVTLENISRNVELLKRAGIPMAIDDFSMGQTSLKYLQSNSFSYVKIDGGLVKDSMNNPRSQEIISSIIQLGKNLNFQVVAEFVETKALQDSLLNMGCDCFQGYLYGKAESADSEERAENWENLGKSAVLEEETQK